MQVLLRQIMTFFEGFSRKQQVTIALFLTDQGDGNDARFSRPTDLDLIQSTPVETVELKTPPRVLTLADQSLDFLEPEPASNSTAQQREEVRNESVQDFE